MKVATVEQLRHETIIAPLTILNVMAAWPEALDLLREAIENGKTHDEESVRKSIMTGRALLWIVFDDGIQAALVTEFLDVPKGLVFRVWLAGARQEAEIDWNEVSNTVMDFAKRSGCKMIELIGRKGWERMFPWGDKEEILMRKEL